MSTRVTPFDPRPLEEPVDHADARAFVHALRASGRLPGRTASSIVALVAMAVFGVFFLFVFTGVALGMLGTFIALAQDGGNGLFAVTGFVPVLFVGGLIALLVVLAARSTRGSSVRMFRLDRFARANGLTYEPQCADPPLPGMIFALGSSRVASDLVRGDRPRFVEFANYRYVTGSGKDRTTHQWGYVAVKLDVPLPNIVLDATSNNGLFGASNLPAAFDRHQRLSLEGDFDQHFSLYCPQGYERDALYLFTPDIMARFIDNAAALDVEIVDDWMFLYARRSLSTLDPATWAWLFSVVGALLDKLAQWARWRDERLVADVAQPAVAAGGPARQASAAASALPFAVPAEVLTPPPPGVAPPGRRLRRRVSWGALVILGLFVLTWLIMQSGVIATFLSGLTP